MDNTTIPSSASPKDSSGAPVILVVDSEAETLNYTTMLLRNFGYNVIMAGSGLDARAIIADVSPVLIITGVTVDDKSGDEFIAELRKNPAAAAIPFIPILHADDPAESRRAYDLGALECLYLPITPDRLYRLIQKHTAEAPRTYLRIRTDLPATIFRSGSLDGVSATVISISDLGMFVRTEEPYDAGSRITCRVSVGGCEIDIEAKVLYTFRAQEGPYGVPGMGLEFVSLSGHGWTVIRQFIRKEITSDTDSC